METPEEKPANSLIGKPCRLVESPSLTKTRQLLRGTIHSQLSQGRVRVLWDNTKTPVTYNFNQITIEEVKN